MNTLGTTLLLAGLVTLFIAQLYALIKVFALSPIKGLLCFIIPGYVLLAAKRYGFYWRFFLVYIGGIVGLVAGGAMLS